eukprot:scaffold47278_cov15-Tisochrysis_lutea.AAC.2
MPLFNAAFACTLDVLWSCFCLPSLTAFLLLHACLSCFYLLVAFAQKPWFSSPTPLQTAIQADGMLLVGQLLQIPGACRNTAA